MTQRQRKRKNEDAVILHLASGCSNNQAAHLAQVSDRTVRKWLAEDPEFRQRVEAQRHTLFQNVFARLVDVGDRAVRTLEKLLDAESEQAQLGAARAILQGMYHARTADELGNRLRDVEERLAEVQAQRGPQIASVGERHA